ncbi:MAG: hypothetical protein ACJ8E4_06990 [Sphingomicrobium sp.]
MLVVIGACSGKDHDGGMAGRFEVARTAKTRDALLHSDWAGKYNGSSPDGDLTVTIRHEGERLAVEIVVTAGVDCAGDIAFTAPLPSSDTLVKELGGGSADLCELTLRRSERTLAVHEGGCTSYHGAICTFDGAVSK